MIKKNLFLCLASFSVNLMSFGSGIGYGWTSPALPKLSGVSENPLATPTTTLENAWITSLFSLGAAFGPFLSGYLSHRIGRKKTLLLLSLPILAAQLIFIFAHVIELFYLARILSGITTGAVYTVIPVYLAEISEDQNRGMVSCALGFMVSVGALFVLIIGPYVSIRNLAYIGIVPAVLFLVLFGFFVPESPYYLVMKNQQQAAEKALQKFRRKSTSNVLQKELLEITRLIKNSEASSGSFRDLYQSKVVVKGLVICNGLFVFQQCTGVVGIMANLQEIFNSTGSSMSSEVSAMLVGFVQVVALVVTSQLIDKLGRRLLLIISTFGTLLSLVLMGTYYFMVEQNWNVDSIFWLPVFSTMLYITAYNFGIGPITFTIVGEIFPSNIKSLTTSLTTTIALTLAFVAALVFPLYTQFLGMAYALWSFALYCAFALVFIVCLVPETKGKSFQEIQYLLGQTK